MRLILMTQTTPQIAPAVAAPRHAGVHSCAANCTRARAQYLQRIDEMRDSDQTTLYVDFSHVLRFEQALAELIESEFCRFEDALRRALLEIVANRHPEYISNEDK